LWIYALQALWLFPFDCQIIDGEDRLPFAYHDVIMDQVITESGVLLKKPEATVQYPFRPAG
jgi:hypothetical protein